MELYGRRRGTLERKKKLPAVSREQLFGFIVFRATVFVITLAITTVLPHFLAGKTIDVRHSINTALEHVAVMLIGGAVVAILYYFRIL